MKNALKIIKYYEGFSAEIYKCPAGLPTIGYGHVVLKNEKFETPISKEFAEELLISDCLKFQKQILRLIKIPLKTNQFEALLSFTFNLGSGALQRSTLRQKINRGEIISAADEFLKWIYAGGRILKGLVLRRKAERELFIQ
ncbi:MAG: lysozyme [Rickettsiales bacterium]|nr:lysozyme [Rickettsiales bacterium]